MFFNIREKKEETKILQNRDCLKTTTFSKRNRLYSTTIGEQGYLAYKMFDKVIKITVDQRVQGADTNQMQFRELLLRLHRGESTICDWQTLLSRQPATVSNLKEFDDAVRLFYGNDEVAKYNYDHLCELGQPVANVSARHSSATAKKLSPDEMSGLEPTIFLAKGANVMLTMNLWASVVLCYGATSIVVNIIRQTNQNPSGLMIAVIVQFDNYFGPSFSDTTQACVPIIPITVTTDGLHEDSNYL